MFKAVCQRHVSVFPLESIGGFVDYSQVSFFEIPDGGHPNHSKDTNEIRMVVNKSESGGDTIREKFLVSCATPIAQFPRERAFRAYAQRSA